MSTFYNWTFLHPSPSSSSQNEMKVGWYNLYCKIENSFHRPYAPRLSEEWRRGIVFTLIFLRSDIAILLVSYVVSWCAKFWNNSRESLWVEWVSESVSRINWVSRCESLWVGESNKLRKSSESVSRWVDWIERVVRSMQCCWVIKASTCEINREYSWI